MTDHGNSLTLSYSNLSITKSIIADIKTDLARSEHHPRGLTPFDIIPIVTGAVSFLFQVAGVSMQAYDMADKGKEKNLDLADIKWILNRVDTK